MARALIRDSVNFRNQRRSHLLLWIVNQPRTSFVLENISSKNNLVYVLVEAGACVLRLVKRILQIAMQSALRPPVPSRNLLRFLRSQSERAFFTPNHGSHAITTPALCRRTRATTSTRKHARTIDLTCEYHETSLEASLIPLEALFKRLRNPKIHCTFTKNQFSTSQPASNWWSRNVDKNSDLTWKERLWGTAKGGMSLKPDDLPSRDEFGDNSMFNNRRTLAAKAASEPRLRCTEVDEYGNVILVDGEFKKTELINKVNHVAPNGYDIR